MENLLINCKVMEQSSPILYNAKIHWISYLIPAILILVGCIGIIPLVLLRGFFQIIGLLLFLLFCKGILKIWKIRTTKIFITQEYLSVSTGIFTKIISDISLQKMEGMQFQQSMIGKILNYGTLIISTGDIYQSFTIQNPQHLRQKLLDNNSQ